MMHAKGERDWLLCSLITHSYSKWVLDLQSEYSMVLLILTWLNFLPMVYGLVIGFVGLCVFMKGHSQAGWWWVRILGAAITLFGLVPVLFQGYFRLVE
ncbi:hypothetical protein [Vibrio mediterranei]|uniref:hypothetical protein n=1 Tax=Vibrio mediterranei TaxID=689 RepID=UPI004069361D